MLSFSKMLLIFLIIIALLVRILPVLGNNFPYLFDNAKDSLVMLEMYQQHKLPLVGPTTSIDGLFYGPAWYYIAFPFNVIGRFHPYSSVVAVLVLALITLFLFYKYVGKFAAVVYALSTGIIGSQFTAWTPYMTSFLLLPILLLFRSLIPKKPVRTVTLAGIAFLTSLLFHFEVAFGIVFLPLILLAVLLMKLRITFKQWVIAGASFFVTLIPSALFELRHQFIQTHSVIHFLTTLGDNAGGIAANRYGVDRVWEVLGYVFENMHLSVLPKDNILFAVLAGFLILLYLRQKQSLEDRRFVYPILIGTFLLYLVLPVKAYYFSALMPVWIYLFAKSVTTFIPKYVVHLSLVFLVLAGLNTYSSTQQMKKLSDEQTYMLSPQSRAVDQAYTFSEGKPFASYQYVPEIYDYVYQLLYLKKGVDGMPMPTEFSYAPGETAYIPQKHVAVSTEKPVFTMLIVEKPAHQAYLDAWWGRVAKDNVIVDQKQINAQIIVYKTIAK